MVLDVMQTDRTARIGAWLENIGAALFYIGALAFVAVLLIGMTDVLRLAFLAPVDAFYSAIEKVAGNFALVILGLTLLAPGLIIAKLGELLQRGT